MIRDYIQSALSYAVVFAVIVLASKWIIVKYRQDKFNIEKELKKIIFGSYIVSLLSQTIMPIWNIFYINGKYKLEISLYNSRRLNLVPLRTIFEYINGNVNNVNNLITGSELSTVNLVGNVCLFIPLGILLPISIEKKQNIKTVILAALLLSIGIEIVQYFVERSSDIDDVILNVFGCLIGYAIYRLVKTLNSKNKTK